ncbi:MAG: hypothetical protein LBN21_10600 [Treponema sp.]|jgi:hypothetical protein|nr:hypothetical protein [Treponema sp.]
MGLLSKASVNNRTATVLPAESAIIEYHLNNPGFQALVLETYSLKIAGAVAYIGAAVPLDSGKALILLPENEDRELLAHCLLHSLNIKTLFHFSSDSPEKALALLSPYM